MQAQTRTVNPVRKLLQLGLLALAVGGFGALGANVALAEDGGCPGHKRHHHHRMSKGDFRKHMDERMNALREKLALTAEQEPAWEELRAAGGKHEGPRRKDREELAKLSAPERMERMIEQMDTHRAHMGEKLEAVKKFYGQLTPEQKATFDAEFMNWRRGGRKGDHHPAPDAGDAATQS